MHERTRRNLCQLAFVALGLLPFCGVVSWIAYRQTPWYAASVRLVWQQRIENATGLLARMKSVEFPAGGTTLLGDLELVDPDGDDLVARIRHVEIAQQPQGIVILLSQPEVLDGMFLRLWDRLHANVLQGRALTQAVQITTGELTFEVGDRAQSFSTVRCTLEPDPHIVRASVEFQLAGREMPAPAQLWITRDRRTSPPLTSWQLKSSTPIPCEIFTDYLPALSRLGQRAEFSGQIAVSLHRESPAAELSGQFWHVDLAQLTEPLPHTLRGEATVTLQRLAIQNGVLQHAVGAIECQPGTMSWSLISSCAQNLPVSVLDGVVPASHTSLTPFDRLGVHFEISADGCVLGTLPGSSSGEVLRVSGRPLLVVNSAVRHPVSALARALCPESRLLVPATDELKSLLTWLPLPAASPPATRVRFSSRQQ